MRLVVSHIVSVVLEVDDNLIPEAVARQVSDNLSIACGSLNRDLEILNESDKMHVAIRSITSRPAP